MEMVKLDVLCDSDVRLVGGWASVEVKDLENDFIPIDEIAKAMVKYIADKDGRIFYKHGNKPIGKLIYWDIRQHPVTGKKGIYIIAKIDKSYLLDDIAWKEIKSGILKGFSISGMGKVEKKIDENGNEYRVIRDVELMEISLVEEPANPYALIEEYNVFAKGIKTSDVPKVVKEIIEVLGGKVDSSTLSKVIEIIDKYNIPRVRNGQDDNEDEDKDEGESMVVIDVDKKLNSTDELLRILIGILDEAKKIRGFVYDHTTSNPFKGMADDIVKTFEALIDEVKQGNIIVVRPDKKKEAEEIKKEEGTLSTEVGVAVENPVYGGKSSKSNEDEDDIVEFVAEDDDIFGGEDIEKEYMQVKKCYVKLARASSKLEELIKKFEGRR